MKWPLPNWSCSKTGANAWTDVGLLVLSKLNIVGDYSKDLNYCFNKELITVYFESMFCTVLHIRH